MLAEWQSPDGKRLYPMATSISSKLSCPGTACALEAQLGTQVPRTQWGTQEGGGWGVGWAFCRGFSWDLKCCSVYRGEPVWSRAGETCKSCIKMESHLSSRPGSVAQRDICRTPETFPCAPVQLGMTSFGGKFAGFAAWSEVTVSSSFNIRAPPGSVLPLSAPVNCR